MPSRRIDVILWDSPESQTVMGSAVSSRGLKFLGDLIGEENEILCVEITMSPSELIPHIPPDVFVVYYRQDGIMVPINEQKSLQ